MPKTLNKVLLIGNVTQDPELRKTEAGTAVCTFGLATNRTGTTETGEKTEKVDYHRIVAWQKLAEVCNEYLRKGRKIYIEGRLTTRSWTGKDGQAKTTTEIVLDDIILLDSKQPRAEEPQAADKTDQ
jgi:single-strand DNA-binding protein